MTEEQPLGLGTKQLLWMVGKVKAGVVEEEGGGKVKQMDLSGFQPDPGQGKV